MKPLRSTAKGEVSAEVCLTNVTMLYLMLEHSIRGETEKRVGLKVRLFVVICELSCPTSIKVYGTAREHIKTPLQPR